MSIAADEITGPAALARVTAEVQPLCVSMLPVETMRPMLDEYVDRRKAFRDWLLSQLVQGVHYGVPPGCEPDARIDPLQWKAKPSLYKAGADFVCDLLQMDPKFSPDVDAWKMLGAKEGTVVMKCELVSRAENPFFRRKAGEVLGEGRGAGVVGPKKRDGNGAIKIAQKSAKIDAVINAMGLSDLFTQDVEPPNPSPTPDANEGSPRVAPRAERPKQTKAGRFNALYARLFQSREGYTLAKFHKDIESMLQRNCDHTKASSFTDEEIGICERELQ